MDQLGKTIIIKILQIQTILLVVQTLINFVPTVAQKLMVMKNSVLIVVQK